MFRSPPQLRSGTKGRPVPLSGPTDKRDLQRSLSDSSTSCPTGATMTGPADQPPKQLDATYVKTCVDTYLSGEGVLQSLFDKFTEQIKATIETAVANALVSVHLEMKKLQDEVKSLTVRLGELDGRLDDKTDELEQYQRRTNLRIFGVEERNGEDTDRLVIDICRDKLGLELSPSQLSRTHRVGKPQPGPTPDGRRRHRPIIVRFCSYRDRRKVFESKKKLKGSGITVKEDLTMRRAELLRMATTRYGVGNTWTQDGRVLWNDQRGARGMATKLADLQAKT